MTKLTHLPLVGHTCISDSVSIGSDNGLSPIRCQAIIWINVGSLSKFSEISIKIQKFSFMKMPLKPFCPSGDELTQWGRVTHICVSKLTIIASDNGLSPGRRQAIIWTNAGILLIEPLRTNFSEIWSKIHTFSFKKMHLKLSSATWRPFCLSLNVLRQHFYKIIWQVLPLLHLVTPVKYEWNPWNLTVTFEKPGEIKEQSFIETHPRDEMLPQEIYNE